MPWLRTSRVRWLFVAVEQAERRRIALGQAEAHVIGPAGGGRNGGGKLVAVRPRFGADFLAGFVVHRERDLGVSLGANSEKILVPGVKVDGHEDGLVLRLERARPVAVANLEAVVRERARHIKRGDARGGLGVTIG